MAGSPGAAYVLKNGIYPGPAAQAPDAIGAAADGSFWLLSQGSLLAFSRDTGTYVSMAPGGNTMVIPQGVAPVDYQHVYFVTTDADDNTVIIEYQQSGLTTLAALPDGDAPAAITAGSDGTFWVVGTSGNIHSYANGTWAAQAAPPAAATVISVGSATFALALAGSEIYQWNGTAWAPFATSSNATWLAACADNAWWQGNSTALTVMLADGVTSHNFVLDEVTFPGYFSAASRYAAFFLAIDPTVRTFGISMACFGLMDQPAETWPSMSTAEQGAYTAITNYFGITDPAGFRSAYVNLNESLDSLALRLTMMTCPARIDATAFAAVQAQLQTELNYAENVRNLFTNLATLNTDLGLEQTQTYAEVVALVGLPPQPSSQPTTSVQVIFGILLSRLLTKAISMAPGPAQSVISLGMSVYNFVADAEARSHGGSDRNSAVMIACARLAGSIAHITTQAVATTGEWETTILGDWGKLQACGASINTGAWFWPPTFTGTVLQGSGSAMKFNFYQTLIPVKWQAMEVFSLSVRGTMSSSTPPNVPAYSLVWKATQDNEGDIGWWFWILTQQGASADINTTGPFPNQTLVLDLVTTTEENFGNLEDVFTNGSGWNLPMVQNGAWIAPDPTLAYQPWQNSTSPLG